MADSDGLTVVGGAGGITARLEDLSRAGALLRAVAGQLGDRARELIGSAGQPGLQVTAPICPVTFARVESALAVAIVGPQGLLTLAARLEGLGVSAGLAAEAYRTSDAAIAAGLHGCELLVGGAAIAALSAGLPALIAGSGMAAGILTVATVGRPDSGQVLSKSLRRVGELTLGLLARHSGFASTLSAGAPAIVALSYRPPVGSAVRATFLRRSGLPTVADLAADIGIAVDLVERANPSRGEYADPGPISTTATQVWWPGPPRDVGDLVARIPRSGPGEAQVHLERLDGADGVRRWVVSMAGTSRWSPVPGREPFDLTGDIRLMSGRPSSGVAGVLAAMRTAGIRRGEPVLVIGHSQGGLLAAAVAADPAVRDEFTVSRVLTTGAPIAAMSIPGDVQVMAIEHTDDLVPSLDGSANRDRPNWVTVRTAAPAPLPTEDPASARQPLRAHNLELYQQTAIRVGHATDPSILAWRRGLAPFVENLRGGAAWDVKISRAPAS